MVDASQIKGQEVKNLKIMINDILKIEDPSQYKLHLAGRNESWVNPLDEYVKSPSLTVALVE